MGRRVLIILLDIREFHCFSGVVQGNVYTIYIFLYNVFFFIFLYEFILLNGAINIYKVLF